MKRWQLVWGLWLAVCLALPSGAYGQRNMPLADSVWARIEAFVGRHFSDYRPTEPMGVKEVRVSRSLRKAEVVCNEPHRLTELRSAYCRMSWPRLSGIKSGRWN